MREDPDDPSPEVLLSEVIGMACPLAEEAVVAAGYDPVALGPEVAAVTMEFRPRRIRLFLDEAGHVTRATAG